MRLLDISTPSGYPIKKCFLRPTSFWETPPRWNGSSYKLHEMNAQCLKIYLWSFSEPNLVFMVTLQFFWGGTGVICWKSRVVVRIKHTERCSFYVLYWRLGSSEAFYVCVFLQIFIIMSAADVIAPQFLPFEPLTLYNVASYYEVK